MNNNTTSIASVTVYEQKKDRPTPQHGLDYLCLLVFLFLLCSALQSVFPMLNEVRPAYTLAICALVVWLTRKLSHQDPFILHAPSYLLIALTVSTMLGVPVALWPHEAFNTTLDAIKILAIFLLISNIVDSYGKLNGIIWALCLGGLLPAAGAMRNYINSENLVEGFRTTWVGIYANPNDLAYTMAMLIPLAIALFSSSQRKTVKLLAIGCTSIYTLTIIFTASRMGFLCLMAILFLTILSGRQYIRSLVLVLVILLLCVPFISSDYLDRIETITSYMSDRSSSGRLEAWEAGMHMFENNPILGVGAGCYILGWPEDLRERYGAVRTAHNTFIQALAELGLLGFTFFSMFLIAIWRLIWRLKNSLLAKQHMLAPEIFRQHYGSLLSVVTALNIGMWVFLVSSLTGGLLFTWYPYIFSAMAVAAQQIYQKQLDNDV
ncbi:MAG: O-antigen ligase family protein [Acidobacteriota bacterium]